MTIGLMRRLFSSSSRAKLPPRYVSSHLWAPQSLGLIKQYQRTITDVHPRQAAVAQAFFKSSDPILHLVVGGDPPPPPNERNVKLGRTIRILHERLPTLLVSPLPQDILSPQISLHLFPSTHHHLPTVRGKLAYTAALWTAPVAWGRVPVVGNVKLKILSERMVKSGGTCGPAALRDERLRVKWETCGKSEKKDHGPVSEAMEKMTHIVGGSRKPDEEFSGLFLFEFDEEGRLAKHTIEHVDENGHLEKTAKFISVTDWLLGRAWRREEASPCLAYARSTKPEKRRPDKDG